MHHGAYFTPLRSHPIIRAKISDHQDYKKIRDECLYIAGYIGPVSGILVRAGVGEKLAMQLTGHRTRNIFDRYNIISDADLHEASERQQAYLAKQKQEPTTVTPMTAGN